VRLFSTKKAKKGFTLIELLVVIAIIGLLSTIVLASLGTARSKGVTASNQMALQQVKNALALYAADNNGTYPATTTALVLGKYISAINPNIAYTPLDSDNNPCSTEPCSDYMLSISSGGAGTVGGSSLEWSSVFGPIFWTPADTFCKDPANGYTRLPTTDELTLALTEQFINSNHSVVGFEGDIGYWSGTNDGSSGADIAGYNISGNNVNSYHINKTQDRYFRCVR